VNHSEPDSNHFAPEFDSFYHLGTINKRSRGRSLRTAAKIYWAEIAGLIKFACKQTHGRMSPRARTDVTPSANLFVFKYLPFAIARLSVSEPAVIQPLLGMFGVGPLELGILAVVLLLLFGNRLPGLMRSVGRSIVEFKKGVNDTDDGQEAVENKK
jgi:sec-independent protein translocase protein TatA